MDNNINFFINLKSKINRIFNSKAANNLAVFFDEIKRFFLARHTIVIAITVLLFIAIDTLFIFHGWWDKNFFVPYNTDETTVLNFMADYFNKGLYNAQGLVAIGYFTFLHNLFFVFLSAVIYLSRHIGLGSAANQTTWDYALMAYSGRFLIVLFTVGLSFYAWKTFGRIFHSKLIAWFFLILLNFNSLYFLCAHYIKYDMIVALLGFVSIYYGWKYFSQRTNLNYFIFYFFAVLAVAAGQYGYVYLLNLVLVTFYVQRFSFFKRKFNIFLLVLAPVIWGALNWQIVIYWRDFLANQNYLNGLANKILPFATDINGLNSFYWYLLCLKDLLGFLIWPLLAIGIFLFVRSKKIEVYYKLLAISFLFYFIQLSLNSLRFDRLLIPFFPLVLFLSFYSLDYFFVKFKKRPARLLAMAVLALFMFIPLSKTVVLAKSLLLSDTRYLVYQWLQNLPDGENINFFHSSICGVFSVAQKFYYENTGKFSSNNVIYSNDADLEEKLNNSRGYLIISLFDLKLFSDNKSIYPKQYSLLKKMLDQNTLVSVFDNNGFIKNNTFGVESSAFSCFQNPPLEIIKITQNDIEADKPYIQLDPKANIIGKWDFEGSAEQDKVLGWDISAVDQSAPNAKLTLTPVEFQNGITKNGVTVSAEDKKIYFFLGYKGSEDGYGFAKKEYEGKLFWASAWIKASANNCVKLAMYKGNITTLSFGEYNFQPSQINKYELIQLRDSFDNPYTLNGEMLFEIQPHCAVTIVNPAAYIGQMTKEEIEKNKADPITGQF